MRTCNAEAQGKKADERSALMKGAVAAIGLTNEQHALPC
jgi:hypothetical protein